MEKDLKKRENDLILNNQGLVYYLSEKFSNVSIYDHDDFASIGMIGLIKAARTFDDSKNIRFATYASRCINNEILMYIRKNKHHSEVTYFEDVITTDSEGNNLTLENVFSQKDSDFAEKFPDKEMLEKFINIVLNYFHGRNRLIWLYNMAGIKQIEISNILQISQSYVSRLERKMKQKSQLLLNSELNFKGVYSMSINESSFFIHFSAKDVNGFNMTFANFLQKRILNRELLEFKVKRVQDTVTIQLPCDAESFAFIADIIKELDSDYTLLCGPKQSKSPEPQIAKANSPVKVQDDDVELPVNSSANEDLSEEKEENNNNLISEEINVPPVPDELSDNGNDLHVSDELSEESGNLPVPNRSGRIKPGISGEIKKYILSLQTSELFTNKQILSKFPSCSNNLLSQITIKLKEKGIISSVSRGMYKKN